jgi:hypothetical protein
MGFISTGDTLNLSAYLTQKGRELLLNGIDTDIIAVYFSLGDSDANYKITNSLAQGFVPDLTGDNTDCIISLANNIGIKYPISYNTNIVPIVPQIQVMFQRADNNQYYNVLDCLVHLDRIGRYQLYHSSANKLNPNRLTVNNALLSPFSNFYNSLSLVINPSLKPSTSDFSNPDSMVFEMLFDFNIFKKLNNTYIQDTVNNVINQSLGNKSPIEMTFSSSIDISGNILYGAGKGSVGIFNREIGYAYQADANSNWTFQPASLTENTLNYNFYTDGNNDILDKYTNFTLAAKIDSKDVNTGQIRSFVYRANQNLDNINDNTLQPLNIETRFANQYAKLFNDDYPIVDGTVSPVQVEGLMQKEISNLKDFVQTSGLFNLSTGTNEYRTSKLSFHVYPKNLNGNNVTPATLNLIFSYNDDILMNGDADTSNISDEGDMNFIQFDFISTNGVFKNRAKSSVFTKNNCGEGSTGSNVVYVVTGGTYTGTTQMEADTLAINDIAANGQNYANTYGTCKTAIQYSSSPLYFYYTKNDCDPGYVGSTVLVSYPAGQFTSTISQFDADQQAALAGQLEANNLGTCSIGEYYYGNQQ